MDVLKVTLTHIVSSLVSNKAAVSITEEMENQILHYKVQVDKADFGKVIGHEGKIAKSIRSIMGAIATLQNVKVIVDIR